MKNPTEMMRFVSNLGVRHGAPSYNLNFYFFLAAVFFLAAGLACDLDGSSAGLT
jgi:hypothetical protein